MRIFILAIATGGGSGYAPMASGTFGSAVGLLVWLAISGFGPVGYALATLAVVVRSGSGRPIGRRRSSGATTTAASRSTRSPACWSRWPGCPRGPRSSLAAFLLFRLFDIWKPQPARAAERLPGGRRRDGGRPGGGRVREPRRPAALARDLRRERARERDATRDGVWVVTIGDELLRGEIVDSNKSHLSERMLALDLESARHVSVPDDPDGDRRGAAPGGCARARGAGLGRARSDARRHHHRGRRAGPSAASSTATRRRSSTCARSSAASTARWPRTTRSRPTSPRARSCSRTRSAPRPASCSR